MLNHFVFGSKLIGSCHKKLYVTGTKYYYFCKVDTLTQTRIIAKFVLQKQRLPLFVPLLYKNLFQSIFFNSNTRYLCYLKCTSEVKNWHVTNSIYTNVYTPSFLELLLPRGFFLINTYLFFISFPVTYFNIIKQYVGHLLLEKYIGQRRHKTKTNFPRWQPWKCPLNVSKLFFILTRGNKMKITKVIKVTVLSYMTHTSFAGVKSIFTVQIVYDVLLQTSRKPWKVIFFVFLSFATPYLIVCQLKNSLQLMMSWLFWSCVLHNIDQYLPVRANDNNKKSLKSSGFLKSYIKYTNWFHFMFIFEK